MYFHTAVKHENDFSDMFGCLQVVRIYSFMKEVKLFICALYTIFFLVKSENNFIEEVKHVLHASIAWSKPLQSLKILELIN